MKIDRVFQELNYELFLFVCMTDQTKCNFRKIKVCNINAAIFIVVIPF